MLTGFVAVGLLMGLLMSSSRTLYPQLTRRWWLGWSWRARGGWRRHATIRSHANDLALEHSASATSDSAVCGMDATEYCERGRETVYTL